MKSAGSAAQTAGDSLNEAVAKARLQVSIAKTLMTIAAARAERAEPQVDAARQKLLVAYRGTRLRRRLER